MTVVAILSLAALTLSVTAALVLRPRCTKSWGAAATFVLPGLALAVTALWLALGGQLALALVAAGAAALCAGAAAVFVPTRAARFRDFERQFWHYVSERAGAHIHLRG